MTVSFSYNLLLIFKDLISCEARYGNIIDF